MGARAPSWDRGGMFFRIALSLIGLRVLDDNFIQPAPGTSPADHLVSGIALLALLGLAAYVQPRLSGFWQGTLTALLGVVGIMFGLDAVHYTRELGLSAGDVSGFVSIGAGLALLGLGASTLFRTRSHDGHRAWRYGRRTLMVASLYIVIPALLFPMGMGYVGARTARAVVPADHLDTPHETVTFKTKDGLKLEGWYIPSRNGAAVISFPGRKGPQRQARMLARHGYGVLLFDRRGEGRSEGVPNTFGWGGDEDIKAAIRYLKTRGDVDPERIGGIGLSVGGELMLEAAAETKDLAAVVSDGAGARSLREELETPGQSPVQTAMFAVGYGIKDATMMLATGEAPPANLKSLVPRIAPRPLLLIADPESENGEKLNRVYYKAAREPKALWEIPHAGHVNGIATHADEYERRVVGFFDSAL
jgi:hypothetical protein